jgi:2,4-dienoyl-CoA reductase-like NADH-dependent reductase (Old Yellow Enzyme family)
MTVQLRSGPDAAPILDPSAALAPLFQPFEGGGLTLNNRVVMAPMTRWKSPDQIPGREVAAYYRRRAENEVGLIVTEGTTIDHPVSSYSVRTPAFHGAALEGWRRVVGEVHEAGGKIVPQLWHVGAMRHPNDDYPNRDLPSASPSGLFRPGGKQANAPLSHSAIREIVDSFARAAAAARELGFDGLEVHGAHGYILDAFLWEGLNRREDEYGGDVARRTRFAVEVIAAIRAAVGPGFPVILRVSQWKQQDYAARLAETPERLREVFQPIADAGVDIFHCSQRRYWDEEFPGSPMNLAGWMKRLFGKPVITVGSVGLSGPMSVTELGSVAHPSLDFDPLVRRLAAGEVDLVAVGRALLIDPQWALKLKQGRFDELLPFDKAALETLS